jgi:hypothetical protein
MNSLRRFARQLTSTVTTVPSGVVKIVLAQPIGGCSPTTVGATPDAGLGVMLGTHLQREPIPGDGIGLFVTETEKLRPREASDPCRDDRRQKFAGRLFHEPVREAGLRQISRRHARPQFTGQRRAS